MASVMQFRRGRKRRGKKDDMALSSEAKDLYEEAAKVMGQAREATRLLMREGLIPAPPETPR